jgi:hypothetical protein
MQSATVASTPEHRLISNVTPAGNAASAGFSEDSMARKENGQIVETATEARQAEPGPSILALLTMSTGLAILLMAVVWFVFFRT